MKKANEPYGSDTSKIEIICSDSAVDQIVKLLDKLEELGKLGASRQIYIDKEGIAFFDGDGSDKIFNINVSSLVWRREIVRRLKNNTLTKQLKQYEENVRKKDPLKSLIQVTSNNKKRIENEMKKEVNRDAGILYKEEFDPSMNGPDDE